MQELFKQAGLVAWPLGICSVIALAVILERIYTLMKLRQLEDRAFMILQMALEKGDTGALRDDQIAGAPVSQVLSSLTEMRTASEESMQRAADIALSMQRLRLRRSLGSLATISSTTPFIGLFGTVWGIMTAFRGMGGESGAAGIDNTVLMSGIAEALSATALGLLVAIPSVIAYNYFVGLVQAQMLHISGHVARLVPLLHHAPASARETTHAR